MKKERVLTHNVKDFMCAHTEVYVHIEILTHYV